MCFGFLKMLSASLIQIRLMTILWWAVGCWLAAGRGKLVVVGGGGDLRAECGCCGGPGKGGPKCMVSR